MTWWPWGRRRLEPDQEPVHRDRDLDAEFERTRDRMSAALADLQRAVERSEFREAARERQHRNRTGPDATPC